MAQSWDYLVFYKPLGDAEALQAELNDRGDQGWELLTAHPVRPGLTPNWLFVFKRPK